MKKAHQPFIMVIDSFIICYKKQPPRASLSKKIAEMKSNFWVTF